MPTDYGLPNRSLRVCVLKCLEDQLRMYVARRITLATGIEAMYVSMCVCPVCTYVL